MRRLTQERLPGSQAGEPAAVTGSSSGHVDGDHLLNPDFDRLVIERATRPAAVLVPLVERNDGLNVLFTKRTERLKSHSGQVSFPGGKIDAADAGPAEAALRETEEEVGIARARIEVLGRLPDYHTGSGYRIAPIVGLVGADQRFRVNQEEVEYIFEVPFAWLMDPANHQVGSRVFEGRRRYFYEMPYGDHYIWGVTAGIIRVLQARLFE